MLEIIDFLVLTFGISGAILLIYKKKCGFLSFIIHSILWGILSYINGNYGALLTCIVFIAIDLFGYIKWSKEEK